MNLPDSSFPSPVRLSPQLIADLHHKHSQELLRFLCGVLRDGVLAQDVCQVAFAKLAERGHEVQPDAYKSWLFRVGMNEALAVRRHEAVGRKVTEQWTWTAEQASGSADEPLLKHESAKLVRQAIEELPEEQRQVVRMRMYEEKTFAVIAEELQIPLGTALGRMRAALQKLRNRLGSE